MLHVATVMVQDYCGRGVEYVENLHDMVRRNLPAGFPGRFVVFTDNPAAFKGMAGIDTELVPEGLKGWWAKLWLFSEQAFPKGDRVLYFDLDTIITGPLDAIAAYNGQFAILRDVYRPDGLQSSVMGWEAGHWPRYLWKRMMDCWYHLSFAEITEKMNKRFPGGDQQWIETFHRPGKDQCEWITDILQDLYPRVFKSYKKECIGGIQKGTSVVFFHGHPRPHEVTDGWVPHIWKVGGGSSVEFVTVGTVPQDKVLDNIRNAIQHDYPVLEQGDPIESLALICGGGPSLADQLALVRNLQIGGAAIFSINQVDGYLRQQSITPNFHVMVDARPELAAWVNSNGIKLYASMCDPETLKAASEQGELTIWHPVTDGIDTIITDALAIGGGTTVGCRAMALAYAMGFRRIACVGFDSCYRQNQHHVYQQTLNDGERVLDVIVGGKRFKAAPWMVQQAEDWRALALELTKMGCTLTVFGEGLIPEIAHTLNQSTDHVDLRARAILERIEDIRNPVGAEVGVFAGDLSRRLLARSDLVLYMVDSWGADHSSSYKASGDFHAKLDQESQDAFCEKAKFVTAFAGERARIIRKPSIEASHDIHNRSLDFVFIDADHSYESVKSDIAAWMPKLKDGGILCGHDYNNPEFPLFGVQRAVDEYFESVELGENFTWFKKVSYESIRTA